MIRSKRTAVAATLIALAVLAGAIFVSAPRLQPLAAPAELGGGYMTGADCQARLDEGTAGLSSNAVAWLENCVEALGSSPSGSPSATQSASPSPSTTLPPSPTVSPTATTPPATTPPASPSPTVSPTGLLTGCFDRLAACGYPHLGNTGIPAGTVLTAYTGPDTIRTAGTVIEDKTMPCIAVEAANVVLRRVGITGPCFYGIDMRTGSLTIEDSEVNCVDGRGTGIAWDHFAARRVYIHDCENALEMGEASSVEDSYLSAREATSEGHGDDIQSQGGNGVLVRHNTFAGVNPITSSIITNPTLNNGWTITDNFLSSGAYTLYCSKQGTGWAVTGNRFYPAKTGNPHSASYGLTDSCDRPGAIAWSGNYRDSDLSVVGSAA